MKLEEMTGVTPELAEALNAVGIVSISNLAAASNETLGEIEGVGEENALALGATARATMDELSKVIEEAVATEMEELAAEEKDLFDESKLDEEAAVSDETAEAEAEESLETKASDQPLFDESALAAEAAESDESVPEVEKVDEVDLFSKGELDDS